MKRVLYLFLFSVCFVTGCTEGNKAPPLAPVKGTVTLDKAPMAGGEVRFHAGTQPAVILKIENGTFSGEVYTGKNRVEVLWEKEGGPNPMNPKEKLVVNAVASQFSGMDSSLKEDIPAGGKNDLKFDVTSAKK